MDSTMVIKVKYGEMLRRLSVRILENNLLDLDINGLRAKIFNLFNFSPDTDVTLTYIDEDGDTVTLVNDDDLRDVMRQQLKFLRIDVHLRNKKNENPHVKSNGNSTPASSPQGQRSFQNISNGIAEVLKSVPEPLPEVLSRFFIDFASKAALASPLLAELAENFIQLGHTNLNPNSQSASVSETTMHNRNVTEEISVEPPVTSAPAPALVGSNASGCAIGKSTLVASDSSIDGKVEDEVYILDTNFINECPFSGVAAGTGSSVPQVLNINQVSRGNGHTEAMGNTFHKGVICDGCGAHPITGPRFKSKVKEDFDLCRICFAEMGNEADYIRIDRPISYRRHPRLRAFSRRHSCVGPRVIDILRSRGGKQSELDSHFVLDVNVLDRTVMAPSTPFTKIWRLLNNGSAVWPRGTQLVWNGGDRFSDSVSVDLEVPADGLLVGRELDIAVDFTAPALSGEYTSYWRLTSPSGEKFGHRIWVTIQVDASFWGPQSNSFQAFDLNLPPIGNGSKGAEDVHTNPIPTIADSALFHPGNSSTTAEPVKPDHNQLGNEKELQFPINNALLVGQNPSAPPDEAASSPVSYPAIESHGLPSSIQAPSVSYPIIDFSEPIPPATPSPKPTTGVSTASSEKISVHIVLEEILLKELDDMGFKEVDLNRDVLRKTKYNLELTVEELCGFSEWDPILEELEEMGFDDKEMNKRLLVKNNGSVKRVVMELISGEKN